MNPAAALAVAAQSRNKADEYLERGNSGRAFAHFLVALKLQPEWRSELKPAFSSCLCAWGQYLEQQNRFQDLFHCYEQALEIFPNNDEVLNNLGAHLLR